jgi:hypothetical protein
MPGFYVERMSLETELWPNRFEMAFLRCAQLFVGFLNGLLAACCVGVAHAAWVEWVP